MKKDFPIIFFIVFIWIRFFPDPDLRGRKSSGYTGWPVKHGRVFLVPWKKRRFSVQIYSGVHWKVDKALFSKYQKHTAMFNWSPCTGSSSNEVFEQDSSDDEEKENADPTITAQVPVDFHIFIWRILDE